MGRLPMLSPEDLDEADRDVLARPINLYRALAHRPELARRYRELGRWFRFESTLDPRLRELVILQVGAVTGSPYEASHHVHVGREFGLTDADIEAVIAETRGETSALDERERAALAATRELTLGIRFSDATWADLGRWFDDGARLELSMVIGFYAMTIRLAGAVELDIEPEYQVYLDEFPGLVDGPVAPTA
jgi:alkylhydroperoxidase family enzyme